MKNLFFIAVSLSFNLAGHAQINLPSKIGGNVLPRQDSTKPAVKSMLQPRKDIALIIDSLVDHSTATRSDVRIYYSIVNSGLADVDIKNITIQSFLNGTPGPAKGIPSPVFTNSSSVLHAGQKWNDRTYNSGLGFSVTVIPFSDVAQPLLVNHTYNISLLADAGNIIAEATENNNTATVSITGKFVPQAIDLAISDLQVRYNAVNKNYDVSATIGNIGTSGVDLNKLSYWDCVNGASYMGYAGPIVLGKMTQANCGYSTCGYSIRLDIHGTSNIIQPGQLITATGIAYGFHGACGGPQEFTYVLDPDNKTGDKNLNNNTITLSVPPQP